MSEPQQWQSPPSVGATPPGAAGSYPAAPGGPPRRGIPGWAIGLIIAGSLILVGILIATAVALGAFANVITSARAGQQVEQPALPPSTNAPSPNDEAALRQAEADAEFIIDTQERYLAAQEDGSILQLVPGGAQVDPDYITAYLYVLTDLRSAVRFTSPSAENAPQLAEYAANVREHERRFLAGEDLDVDVSITRKDGSVFESDGKYRTRDN